MKKLLSASLLIAASLNVQADIAGLKGGVEYWPVKSDNNAGSAYFQLEHPMPLLPNLAVRGTRVEDKEYTLTTYDTFGYYEIFDNSLVSLDLGAGLHRIEAGNYSTNIDDDTLGMVTTDIELLPDNDVSFYSKINYARSSDSRVTDTGIGVRLNILAAFYFQAGYRQYDLDQDDGFSDTIKGVTAGLHVDL